MDTIIHDYLLHPSVVLTLKACLMALVLQFLTGVPIGLYLARKNTIFRRFGEIIVTLPMIFPPMASGYFLLLLLGRKGPIGKLWEQLFHSKILFS